MPPVAAPAELNAIALARSAWVVAGLLLLAIGLGDLAVGRVKLHQYRDMLEQLPAVERRDPAALFPKATESDEQRGVAQTKLRYYEVLFLAGQVMTLGGLLSLAIGVVRVRSRALTMARATSRSR